jgi:hypothetical protein
MHSRHALMPLPALTAPAPHSPSCVRSCPPAAPATWRGPEGPRTRPWGGRGCRCQAGASAAAAQMVTVIGTAATAACLSNCLDGQRRCWHAQDDRTHVQRCTVAAAHTFSLQIRPPRVTLHPPTWAKHFAPYVHAVAASSTTRADPACPAGPTCMHTQKFCAFHTNSTPR